MAKAKKTTTDAAPVTPGPDYKMLFEKATETITALGERLSMARNGAAITRGRVAAYHAGLGARRITPEDRRCCTLIDGLFLPVMAGIDGSLQIIGGKVETRNGA